MANWTGIGAGLRQAELDKQATELHNLSMQKEEIGVMSAMMTLSQQSQMLKTMQGGQGQPPSPETLAANMDRMSTAAAGAGLFDKAEKFATAGSMIRKNQAEIDTQQAKSNASDLTVLSSILNNPRMPVNDQESWQKANMAFQLETRKPSPFAKLPYDPETVGRLQIEVQTAKDAALTNLRNSQAKAADAAEKEHEARLPLIKAQTIVAEQRAANLAKVGSNIKPPTSTQLRAVTDLLVGDFGAALAPEDQRDLSRKPAERVAELMAVDKLPLSEAAAKAYQEAKERGDFGGIRPKTPMAGTAQKPLEIPDDKTKLRPNMFYQGKGKYQGQSLLWTGTGFKVVNPASQPAE
jgi:hypothetical protein